VDVYTGISGTSAVVEKHARRVMTEWLLSPENTPQPLVSAMILGYCFTALWSACS
jgi:hypothetical protein